MSSLVDMSYEQSLAEVTQVITTHDTQPRREEEQTGRWQQPHWVQGCMSRCPHITPSNQAVQEEVRDRRIIE